MDQCGTKTLFTPEGRKLIMEHLQRNLGPGGKLEIGHCGHIRVMMERHEPVWEQILPIVRGEWFHLADKGALRMYKIYKGPPGG